MTRKKIGKKFQIEVRIEVRIEGWIEGTKYYLSNANMLIIQTFFDPQTLKRRKFL